MITEFEQLIEAAMQELARNPLLDTWSKVEIARRIEAIVENTTQALLAQADREDEAAYEAEMNAAE